ncbi:hypothetical protein MNBD_PLANCTO02-676 [hydrothermal vent metagenome]|uniref:Chromosome partition protein Smc n=1 Tax=hydrothermal vent metagenome TaxID=652676 RepID=A0A3B1DPX1_9ZZZZ
MLKKMLIGSGILVSTVAFLFGAGAWSYLSTSAKMVRDSVTSEIPVEFEVQRAREMVENLVPDIRRCMHVTAEQQVDIENLQAEIDRKTDSMVNQKQEILVLRSDLQSGNKQFVYASHTYSASDVKQDLATRFERYKLSEDSLKRDRQVLAARKKALESNQEKLDSMLVAKKDMEVQIENLEARLKAVQAAETVSTLEIDDSQLTRAKTLIRELNKQMDVKEKVLASEGSLTGSIPVDLKKKTSGNIANEIDEYFESKPEKKSEGKTNNGVARLVPSAN